MPQWLGVGVIVGVTLHFSTHCHLISSATCLTCLLSLNLRSLLFCCQFICVAFEPFLPCFLLFCVSSTCRNTCCPASASLDLFACFDCPRVTNCKLVYWNIANCLYPYVQYHCLHFGPATHYQLPSFWQILTQLFPWMRERSWPTPSSCSVRSAKMHPERSSSLHSTPACVLQTLACQVSPWAGRNLGHSTARSCGQMSPRTRSWIFKFFPSFFQILPGYFQSFPFD